MLLLALRFAKLTAAMLYATGTLGAFVGGDLAQRRRFAYHLAGPGFGLSWVFGFLLSDRTGTSLLSSWILLGMLASFVSLQAVLFVAGREGRNGPGAASVAVLGWLLTVAAMVFRPGA